MSEKPNIYRLFGVSPESESSERESLGRLHQEFILEVIRQEQEREQAAIDNFLETKEP